MKPAHYVKRVKESEEFKKLMKEDAKAYFCSMFFVRDFVEDKDETQVDFYSPKKKTIVSFKADGKIEQAPNKKAETVAHKRFIPKPLKETIKMDIDEMKSVLEDEMHNRDMTYEVEKVLGFLTTVYDKPVWNCTGFLKGLGLLQAHIDDETASILFMEKKSFMDMIRFTGQSPMMGPGLQEAVTPQIPNIKIISPEELKALKKEQAEAEAKEKGEEKAGEKQEQKPKKSDKKTK